MGTGWNMAGISVITRVGSNNFQDDNVAPIEFNMDDHFVLDGKRLVVTNGGNYGDPGTEYDTELAAFSKIMSHGSFNQGPGHFTIITKDGMYLEYGKANNSKQIISVFDGLNSVPQVATWLLNRIEDPYGNYISYHYINATSGNELLLDEIRYTGNDIQGLAPYNKVELDYSVRQDKNSSFWGGQLGSRIPYHHLLEQVTITTGTDHVKSYDLVYSLRDIGRSYLAELIEIGADGSQLNSTLIKYGGSNALIDQSFSGPTFTSSEDVFTADFDGSGISDIMRMQKHFDSYGNPYHTDLEVYLNGNTTASYYDNLNSTSNELKWVYNISMVGSDGSYSQYSTTDMNGDGRSDVLIVKLEEDLNGLNKYTFADITILETQGTSSGNFVPINIPFPEPVYRYVARTWNFLFPGDYNGDGLIDLLVVVEDLSSQIVKLYLLTDLTSGNWQEVSHPGNHSHMAGADLVTSMDIDGDGKPELLFLNDAYGSLSPISCMTLRIDAGGLSAEALPNTGIPSSGTDEYTIRPGDFNGDGKMDLLSKNSDDEWRVQYSMGTKLTGYNFAAPVDLDEDYVEDDLLLVSDFNGDGMSDIFHRSTFEDQAIRVHYAIGCNNYNSASFTNGVDHGLDMEVLNYLRIGDLNGDGSADILNKKDFGATSQVYLFNPHGKGRLLHKTRDGFGRVNEFEYGNMTELVAHAYCIDDYTAPLICTRFPMKLVVSHKQPNGIGGASETTYRYFEAKVHVAKKSFLGFTKVLADSYDLDRRVTRIFSFDEDYGLQLPYQLLEGRGSFDPYTTTTFNPEIEDLAGGDLYYIRTSSESVYDHLAQTTRTTTNSNWDAFGNPQQTTLQVTYSGNTIESDSRSILYGAFGPSAVPSKMTMTSQTRTRDGSPPVFKTSSFDYDATYGHLTKSIEFEGQAKEVQTDLYYDDFGNVRKSSTHYPGLLALEPRVVEYEFGLEGRFPTKKINKWYDNSAGALRPIITSFKYNKKWGRPSKITGPDGLITEFTYDAFGRTLSTSAPHRANSPRYDVTLSRSWNVSGLEYFVTHVNDPSGPDQWTYHDILGREVRKEVETAGHDLSTSSTTYNIQGNVFQTTAPHFTSEPVLTTTNTYDDLNRLTQSNNSLTGAVTMDHSYGNGQQTVLITNTSTGRWSSKTTDATGQVIQASDDGGELNYTYDSWGNLLTVQHGGLTVVTNTYDAYGRQSSLTDLSAGTTRYVYNAFGELVSQEDANGSVTTSKYDNLGRLIKRIDATGTTNYDHFFDGTEFSNNITRISGPYMTEIFEYDILHRLSSSTRSYDGKNFTTAFISDPIFDRITNVTYPSGVEISNQYNALGFLDQVVHTSSAAVLWQAGTVNGLGQYKSYTLADGKTTSRRYFHGFPTQFFSTGVQDLRLSYDYPTADLTDRWDALLGLREYFEYDDLDRLTSATVHSVNQYGNSLAIYPPQDFTYDVGAGVSRGKMLEHTDIGKFTYSNHQVSKAHGFDFPQDPNHPPQVINFEFPQEITYTPFNQPASITESVDNIDYELYYDYGNDQQRCRSELVADSDPLKTIWYNGSHEKAEINGSEYEIHYIPSASGICAMIVIENGVESIYPVYTDHLGSIVALTDVSGNIVARQQYDAWGRSRNVDDWSYTNIDPVPKWIYRGFTGHEHLRQFTLINMNGRMYDPLTTRMLSPDNFVASSINSQAFNRYAYALNNPLKYTDPDGELPFLAIVAIAAAVGGTTNLAVNAKNVDNVWDGFYYFGVGAAVGAAATVGGAALAPVLGTGAIAGATLGAASGFTLGFANTAFTTGGDFNAALRAGGNGALIGGISGALIAGTGAGLSDRNVWTGAQPKPGQSPFSFRSGLHSNPSFRFGDTYDLTNNNFWKYGHTNVQNVQFIQDSEGNLVESVYANDFAGGRSLSNPSSRYQITGNSFRNPDGTFTTTITKQSYQTITTPIGASPGAGFLGQNVTGNTITFTTLNRANYFIIGGQIPRNYGGGFYSIFQIP